MLLKFALKLQKNDKTKNSIFVNLSKENDWQT